jgi:hypothetical protein
MSAASGDGSEAAGALASTSVTEGNGDLDPLGLLNNAMVSTVVQ